MVAGVRKLPQPLPSRRRRLVIHETGASSLPPADGEGCDETFVVLQMKGETPQAFAERALDRVAHFRRERSGLALAILKLNAACDEPAHHGRRALLLALVEHAREQRGLSEIRLEVTSAAGTGTDLELLGLVDSVLELAPPELSIVVRFDTGTPDPELASGVNWPSV